MCNLLSLSSVIIEPFVFIQQEIEHNKVGLETLSNSFFGIYGKNLHQRFPTYQKLQCGEMPIIYPYLIGGVGGYRPTIV